jgi:hypothetical protein
VDANFAWAAGLFEGEGCFSWSQGRVVLKVVSTDREVLERFHAVVGCGGVYPIKSPSKKQPHWKPAWLWTACGLEDVKAVMVEFEPWLGERRTARWRELAARRQALEEERAKPRACQLCGKPFVASTFHPRQRVCKRSACRRSRQASYQRKHREEHAAYQRAYQARKRAAA